MPEDFDKTFDIQNFEEVISKGTTDDKRPAPELEPDQNQDTEQSDADAPVEQLEQKTEEEAENEALSEAEEETEAKAAAKAPKKRDHAEARIAKLVKEKERLKGQLDALRNQGQPHSVQVNEPVFDPDAPNPANYPNGERDDDYRIDMKFYQRDFQTRVGTFQAQKQAMLAKYKDELPELIEMDQERVASGIKTSSPTVFKLILESEQSGELWHYLLANSDEAISIARMDPIRAAKAIGRIEAKLITDEPDSDEPVQQKRTLPAPIKPVKTTTQNKAAATKNFGFVGY